MVDELTFKPTDALIFDKLTPPLLVTELELVSAREMLRLPGPWPSTRHEDEFGQVVEFDIDLTLLTDSMVPQGMGPPCGVATSDSAAYDGAAIPKLRTAASAIDTAAFLHVLRCIVGPSVVALSCVSAATASRWRAG